MVTETDCFPPDIAPLGKKSMIGYPICGIVWHDAVSGRNDEDICSTYCKFMQDPAYRDCKKFTFYMDNCAAQNKNWTIYTGMVSEVNRPGGSESITFKYFEKGHTFMSTDSFHAQVEKGMRSKKNIFDFNDKMSSTRRVMQSLWSMMIFGSGRMG